MDPPPYGRGPDTNDPLLVRLKDLEQGMKAVIRELSPGREIIHYETTVQEINQNNPKASLSLRSGDVISQISDVDLIVNAEGSGSSTNKLLGIGRMQYLPKLSVISAVFVDNCPKITGLGSFLEAARKKFMQTATSVYYCAIFLFRFIFMGERLVNNSRCIAGAVAFSTPGQTYVGTGLSATESAKLMILKNKVEEKREEVKKNQNPALAVRLEKELAARELELNSFVRYWASLSLCVPNLITSIVKIASAIQRVSYPVQTSSRFPLRETSVFEIGADKANEYTREMNETAYIVCGDAMVTVDPVTGLGANTAIRTVKSFKEVLGRMALNIPVSDVLLQYNVSSAETVTNLHRQSLQARRSYRPDAVNVG